MIDPWQWQQCAGDPDAEQALLDQAAERRATAQKGHNQP